MKRIYFVQLKIYFCLGISLFFQYAMIAPGLASSWETSVSSLRLSIEELSVKNREIAQENQRLVDQIKLLKKEKTRIVDDNNNFSSEQQVLARLLKEKEKVILYLNRRLHRAEQKNKNFLETANIYRKGLDQRKEAAEALRKNVSILDQELVDMGKEKNDQERQQESDYFNLEQEIKAQADLLLAEKQENQGIISEISVLSQHNERDSKEIQSLEQEAMSMDQKISLIRHGQKTIEQQINDANFSFEEFAQEKKESIKRLEQEIHAVEIEKDGLVEALSKKKETFRSLRFSAGRNDESPSVNKLQEINQQNDSLRQQLGRLKRNLASINAQIISIQDLLTK